MSTVYLIYKPILDYEDSESALLVCLTKERADAVREELIQWCINTESKMPRVPRDVDGNLPDDQTVLDVAMEKRWEAWASLREKEFPYELSDLAYVFTGGLDKFAHSPEDFLSIREIKIV